MSSMVVPLWCWLALNQLAATALHSPSAPPAGRNRTRAIYSAPAPPPAYGSPPRDGDRNPPGWNTVPQFRLGLSFLHVIREDGDFTAPGVQTSAAGLDFGFTSGYTRTHLGLAHQWESAGNTTARGFRFDLIGVGWPIPLLVSTPVRIHLEPILTVLRLQIMFASGNPTRFRLESGFGVMLSVAYQQWFLGLQPFAIDFRYLSATSDKKDTGLTRVWPFQIVIGREF